jgi:glycerophosphoryl diester phosphodiesterase
MAVSLKHHIPDNPDILNILDIPDIQPIIPMQILEQNLIAKNPQKKSEDGIVVTPDFVAVIDGSTSKSQYRHSLFHSNGRYAMLLTARYIRRMPKTITCEEFLRGVTAAIRKHYRKSMLPRLAEHPEDRLTCSAVVFSRVCREIWMVGDCQCMVSSAPDHSAALYYDNPKPYEAELAAMRAEKVRQLLDEGMTTEELCRNDIARPTIIPRMLETMRQQNIGYSVIDGFHIARNHVRTISLDFQSWEIVLASDGYPQLFPTLAESEQHLQQQRENDPLNIGLFQATKAFHPDFNSFDDRAYIRLRV